MAAPETSDLEKSEYVFRLPDIGEGVAEAELVEWHVAVGDRVLADQPLADVMTGKATVELSSPRGGIVVALGGEPGDLIAVGGELVRLRLDGPEDVTAGEEAADHTDIPVKATDTTPVPPSAILATTPDEAEALPTAQPQAPSQAHLPGRPLASPAVRRRAAEAGLDLATVAGSGPAGRIEHGDVDRVLNGPKSQASQTGPDLSATPTKVTGLRRQIANRLSYVNAHVPQITYVEEIDVTALEELRTTLNSRPDTPTRLTVLPFLMLALVRAIRIHPAMNAHFDDETGILTRYGGVHLGIATQTPAGLMVPVVRHAETLDLWTGARELTRVAQAARDATATPAELSGSTITITSLGALGGVVSTPLLNAPEVAIIGVNKMQVRPVWDGGTFRPRTMMNLSSTFDHRIVDGWDAARFVRSIKELLEQPALIFVGGDGA